MKLFKKKIFYYIIQMHHNNLLIIQELDNNTLLSYSDNQLKIDDRYFASYRSGYDIDKIIFILRNSFMYFLKIYELEQGLVHEEEKIYMNPSILGFINNTLKSLKDYNENCYYSDNDKKKILDLSKFIEENIEIIDNKFKDDNSNKEYKYINYYETNYNINKNLYDSIMDNIYYSYETIKNFFFESYGYIRGLIKRN